MVAFNPPFPPAGPADEQPLEMVECDALPPHIVQIRTAIQNLSLESEAVLDQVLESLARALNVSLLSE
jgi:hypothetical protein